MGKVPGPEALWLPDEPDVWLAETVGQYLARQAGERPDAAVLHTIDAAGGALVT